MSTELPVSTKIRPALKLAITKVMTRRSSCGHFIPSKSFREKEDSGNSGRAPDLTVFMSLLAYSRLTLSESPPPLLPQEMTFTPPVMLGVYPRIPNYPCRNADSHSGSPCGRYDAPLNLVLRRVCLATLAERASTCCRNAATTLGGGAKAVASPVVASWRLCCPVTGSFPFRVGGVWV
ncbi:hypothetical protein LIER_41356 [Lithospermum erythrorhizon]|uniref:Uncharacterized protein n=1 Tax=Lithospermum erythrorhizon TaxID=34254 RepID=A0AAV3RB91_LITER